jgi:hypothetical protein
MLTCWTGLLAPSANMEDPPPRARPPYRDLPLLRVQGALRSAREDPERHLQVSSSIQLSAEVWAPIRHPVL